jgi:hypothetical protein
MENLKSKLARIEAGLRNPMAGGNASFEDIQHDKAGRSDVSHRAPDSTSAQAGSNPRLEVSHATNTVPGPNSLLMPSTGPDGWVGDPRWPSFIPEVRDFRQPFTVAGGQNFFATDPVDFSPFGLEELLIAGVNHHI